MLLRLSKPRLAIRLVPYRSKWGPVGPTKSVRFSTACELYPRSILHVVLKSRSRVEKSSLDTDIRTLNQNKWIRVHRIRVNGLGMDDEFPSSIFVHVTTNNLI